MKSESQSFIEKIQNETKWISGYLTVGYISDSNIAQSSTSNLKGGPDSIIGGPPVVGDSSSISDKASWLGFGLTLNPYTTYSKNVTFNLSFSSPFYSNQYKSYDYKVYGADINSNFRTDHGDWWGLKLQYLKTYYDTTESESYLNFEPYYNWNISNDWSLKFMAMYSKYLKTTGASIITPAISTYYSLMNGFGLKGGASYALAKGNQANYIPGNPPTMVSGSMFSNYKTYGAYLGYWWQLPASFEFSGQVAYYKTTYNHETAPVPAGQASPADRTDTLNQYSFDLLYSVIPNKWVFDLSASFSKNGSTGFQGLPTYGSLTTYKYDRNYYLLTTTYYY